ncbi:MAG: glycosyltransferase N-terminal domain-containing protein [bacterium]|nr:glycosyltransferase N-terminal domain-containing protein [bacterium]
MVVYNLLVLIYGLVIRVASLNSEKARLWVEGRKNWKDKLSKKIHSIGPGPRIWVHCASYGEFEQGKPLIEAIRTKHPDHKLVLSFFSPSGYEAFKDWKGTDLICYLPLDTKINAKDFINLVQPKTAIFIKYEFWVNFLFQLKEQQIPTFLVSAVFKSHHPFFKWYGAIFRRSLQTFEKLFVQDENSARLLETIGITRFQVSGDTRFDRVLEIRTNFSPNTYFEKFCAGYKLLIAGSTWPKDEEFLIDMFQSLNDPLLKLVIVPHQVDNKNIQNTLALLERKQVIFSLYSTKKPDLNTNVLIIDAMGLLSKIYHYAHVAYIGGGFNSGIHNCLEPAVFLKPIIFYGGDDYHKYNEAVDLIAMGAAKNVHDSKDLQEAVTLFLNDTLIVRQIESKLQTYFEKNSGTTNKVMTAIKWD